MRISEVKKRGIELKVFHAAVQGRIRHALLHI